MPVVKKPLSGSSLFKKRVAREGQGKRGSYRTIIAYLHGDRAFFLFGFDKGAKDNISEKEKKVLAKMAKELMGYTQPTINKAVKSGALIEIEVEL
jgi:hypothetical protein